MASMKNLPPCPDSLKPLLHYLKAAFEHDNRDPVVAYWLRFHAVQLGIRIDSKSKPAKTFIGAIMDQLETSKKSLKTNEAVSTDMVAQAHIENYALKLFSWADAEDRAEHFDKNVIKAFYTAGLLFDVLAVWGDVGEEIQRQQKYAKWKAAYIHNCLKSGETPIAGPLAEGAGNEMDTFDQDTHNNMSNSMTTSISGGIPPAAPAASNSGPSAYDKLFLPPAGQNYPSVPTDHQPAAKPPNTLPVAPPRGSAAAGKVQTPSPSVERKSAVIANPMGVPLSSDDIARAQKNLKHAGSALQFDDITTSVELLEKTLRLLRTGRED